MHVLARKETYIVAKHVIINRIFGECYMDTIEQLAKPIDHTLLKPDAAKADTKRLYEETKKAFGLFVLNQPTHH